VDSLLTIVIDLLVGLLKFVGFALASSCRKTLKLNDVELQMGPHFYTKSHA